MILKNIKDFDITIKHIYDEITVVIQPSDTYKARLERQLGGDRYKALTREYTAFGVVDNDRHLEIALRCLERSFDMNVRDLLELKVKEGGE